MDQHFYPVSYEERYNATVYRVPFSVRETIVPNADDDGYSVYLSEDLSEEEAEYAFRHAISHVDRNDFDKLDVQVIEAEAHGQEEPKPTIDVETPDFEKNKRRQKRRWKKYEREIQARNEFFEMIGVDPELIVLSKEEKRKLEP